MLNDRRAFFKPTLKTLNPSNTTLKRYAFDPSSIEQDLNPALSDHQDLTYPTLEQKVQLPQNQPLNAVPFYKSPKPTNLLNDFQSKSPANITRFDPILPKFLFKRFLSDAQQLQNHSKNLNNQLIQQLKVKNVNYPFEVEQLIKQVQEKKFLYKKSIQPEESMIDENFINSSNEAKHSVKQNNEKNSFKGIQKIPFAPIFGTDGSIFWAFSIDKVVLWRYKSQNYSNPDVFSILNFEKEALPISAVYATHIQSSIFKHERTILISIAFYDELKFFSFDILNYEKEYIFNISSNHKTEEELLKYVQKVMIKVSAKFFIEKILIQNIPNHFSDTKHLRPLVIFTDGAKDIEIVDLQNLAAYKSHGQFDFISIKQRRKANQSQNQIIKLLHCKDDVNPLVHFAFVLKKQILDEAVAPKTLLEKFKNIFTKSYQKKERMILSIYEWNETELKNDTLYKKVWNPQRIKKIKDLTSSDLAARLKQNFFDFCRLNANNQFVIADVSLVEKNPNLNLFDVSGGKQGCNLKVSFTNGTSVFISNFRTLTFSSGVKVNRYIEGALPISNCQYHNYRKLLDKGKYFQTQNEVKNKFNLYTYEPIEAEKEPRYSKIDPVLSECDGLTICQSKIIFEDPIQILYEFRDTSSRKRIHKVQSGKNSNQKSFMIFENSFITVVDTPNIAQNFLVIGYLHKKYPDSKQKIKDYANSVFAQFQQQQKINLLQSIIELLMQIQASGKGKESIIQSKAVFNDLVMEFYSQDNKIMDETSYLEEKDINSQNLEEVYKYKVDVSKAEYQNFVDYVLGAEALKKEKQALKSMNSSFNGKTFSFSVSQSIFQFLIELLVEHGIKEVSEKYLKTTNNLIELSNSLSKYISASVKNSNDQKYLTNLFLGMHEVKESFMMSGLSKKVIGLIQPVLEVSYKDFHTLKSLVNSVGQKLDELNVFLERFIQHCSFKNNKVQIFEETVLFCKSLNNSLPKVSLILRLFESLSEVQYCNPSLQSLHKAHWNEVTLKNLLFKVETKDFLSRITVQNLFEENSIMLDELEEKLPELNEIKYLRFYLGWKKLNKNIIKNIQIKEEQAPKHDEAWFFNFFNNQKPKKQVKKSLLFENEEQKIEQILIKKKQEQFSIEKALNQQSYDDFERYFTVKSQFSDFVNILLSKIYHLQLTYLDLKQKYNFNDEMHQSFNDFMRRTQKNQSIQIEGKANSFQNRNEKTIGFRSFLSYEQKVCGHQKYFKTYGQIKFFNEKILNFFDKILSIYKIENQKEKKNLNSLTGQKETHWNQKKGQNQNHFSKHDKIVNEIQTTVNVLMSQGSELMRSQISKKLSADPFLQAFMKKERHLIEQSVKMPYNEQERRKIANQMQRDGLVKKDPHEKGAQKIKLEEEQRRRMFEQGVNEKISREFRDAYENFFKNDWMQIHNQVSQQAFTQRRF